ncbi:MAG: uroporphyrinogen-III synthase [Planctomycetaceae bacterium]
MSESRRPVLCSFESRRASEMASLIERQGGTALVAPSMRELPIEENPVALDAIRRIIHGDFPSVVLMTGVGTEALFDVARSAGLFDSLLAALQKCTIIVRGPKPVVVLGKVGLKYDIKAPEPNTWQEILTAIDSASLNLQGQAVAVQEYGLPNQRFYAALEARGATITRVPVYRWALPEDVGPLLAAIEKIAAGQVDAMLFTSANQVTNVLGVARDAGAEDALRKAVEQGTRVISIGPTCTEALQDQNFPVHGEASPPKMGQLVRVALEVLGVSRSEIPANDESPV